MPDIARNAESHTETHTVCHPSRDALSTPLSITAWVLQIGIAFMLGQTLYFKFSGAPETVAMFEILNAEPFGRYAAGTLELAAVVLLLIPRTSAVGALVSLMAITGAIGAHVTKLGISIDAEAIGTPAIEPLNGPSLFIMALGIFIASSVILFIRRRSLPVIGTRLRKSTDTPHAA